MTLILIAAAAVSSSINHFFNESSLCFASKPSLVVLSVNHLRYWELLLYVCRPVSIHELLLQTPSQRRSAKGPLCIKAQHLNHISITRALATSHASSSLAMEGCEYLESIWSTSCLLNLAVPSEVLAAYIVIIDDILAKSDLQTISSKRIREGLQKAVDYDITPHKVMQPHTMFLVFI